MKGLGSLSRAYVAACIGVACALNPLMTAAVTAAAPEADCRAANPKALSDGDRWGESEHGFQIVSQPKQLEIVLDGQPIAVYVFQHDAVLRPFLAHVRTPSGRQVTRNFPPLAGQDATDHADMHPGIWLAFGKLNDNDFWRNRGRVVHLGFVGEPQASADRAAFVTCNEYQSPGGEVVCRMEARYQLARDPAGYRIDLDAAFASDKPIVFGVQEEMGLGLRIAMRLAVRDGSGAIVNSEGGRNEAGTWGRVATWWDYFGTLDGKPVGVMIMSAPGNPDVWSHSRDYGFLAANPFPVDRPENRSKTTVVAPGETFHLRFGVLVHEHDEGADFDRKAAYQRYLTAIRATQAHLEKGGERP